MRDWDICAICGYVDQHCEMADARLIIKSMCPARTTFRPVSSSLRSTTSVLSFETQAMSRCYVKSPHAYC